MPKLLTELTTTELNAIRRDRALILFSFGNIEGQGPHLPVGMNHTLADRLARGIASRLEQELQEWQVLIVPAMPLSAEANTNDLTLRVRPYVVRDFLVDACRSLSVNGFQQFACVSAFVGPKQLTAIEEAGKILKRRIFPLRINRKIDFYSLSSQGIPWKEIARSPFVPAPPEHAGSQDTSLSLMMNASLVNPIYKSLPPQERPQGLLARRSSYWGNPSHASIDIGQKWLDERATYLARELVKALSGHGKKPKFRSWYSLLPPNSAFFRAWTLLFLILLLMIFWVYLYQELFKIT